MKVKKARITACATAAICLAAAMATTTAQENAQTTYDAKWRYMSSCAGCHDKDGSGIYAFGPALKGNVFVQNAPPAALIEVIQKGRNYANRSYPEYVGMPAYQWIRGGEAEALVQYLKTELQQ